MESFEEKIRALRAMTERSLEGLFTEDAPWKTLLDAMRYSLLAGGKRLRPVLCLAFCEAASGRAETALPAAQAIELVHTFSLIHDDLPCMDDSALRRGKPTNHRVYGEDMAVLAGDALLTAAFRLLAQAKAPAERALRCVELLSTAAGENGMGAGQTLDLRALPSGMTEAELKEMHERKTGDMIRAACQMGTVLGGGTPEQTQAAGSYGAALGLAFQICDDMLDCTGTAEELGKDAGQDEKNGRTTFMTLFGLEGCRRRAEELTELASRSLASADFRETGLLEHIASSLVTWK